MLVGENSSSSVRTVEAGETASIFAATAWMVCPSLALYLAAPGGLTQLAGD